MLAGAIGVSAGTNVLADGHDIPVSIVSIDPQTEMIGVANEGDEDVDLSRYIVHYEWTRENDQEDTIPEGSVIEVGEQVTLDTGCTDLAGDITLGDFGNCRFIHERAGVLALLSPGREVVDTCEYEKYVPGEGGGEREDESDDEDGADEEGADDDGQHEDDNHEEEEEKTDEKSGEDDC